MSENSAPRNTVSRDYPMNGIVIQLCEYWQLALSLAGIEVSRVMTAYLMSYSGFPQINFAMNKSRVRHRCQNKSDPRKILMPDL